MAFDFVRVPYGNTTLVSEQFDLRADADVVPMALEQTSCNHRTRRAAVHRAVTAVQSSARSPTAPPSPTPLLDPAADTGYSASATTGSNPDQTYGDQHSPSSDRWNGSRAARWTDPAGTAPPTTVMHPTGHASRKASSFATFQATSRPRQTSISSLKPTASSAPWSQPSPAVISATTSATTLPTRGASPVRQRSSQMPGTAGADYHISLSSPDRQMLDEMPKWQTTPPLSVVRQVFDEMPEWRTDGFSPAPLAAVSDYTQQPSENPFGDSPFKALPSHDNFNIQGQSFASLHSNATASNPSMPTQPTSLPANPETVPNFEFSDTFPGISYGAPSIHGAQAPASTTSPFPPSQSGNDILGGILPQPGVSATMYPAPAPSYHLNPTSLPPAPVAHYGAVTPFGYPAPASVSSGTFEASHAAPLPATTGQVGPVFSVASPAPIPTPAQSSHLGYTAPLNSQIPPAPAASTAPVPSGSYAVAQQQKDKFEPKSAVWADTLSRGLVNLNISGSKINPLADIGVDFDAINRKEKRTQKEKSSANPVTSTITMGKAMGSGSGIGRAGASGITQPPNPTMGGGSGSMAGGRGMPMGMGMGMGTGMGMSGGPGMGMGMGGSPGMNMGMGMGMGTGMGMGSYGGMNQPMGGMGFNMGMGQGAQMRPPSGPGMPGGYNPMLGTGGGYGSQQPYGGYR